MTKKSIKVCITWEHGDADFQTKAEHSFKTEKDARDFLNFLFDFRKFVRGKGWENLGHFSDDYYTGLPEWREKIVKAHGGKFGDLIQIDKSGGGNHSASIEHIYVKIGNTKHSIVWTKGFKKTVLPEKGKTINLTTGMINGYGVDVFGGKSKDYIYFEAFKDLGEPKGKDGMDEKKYPKIKGTVLDCKPDFYKRSGFDHDFTNIHYIVLCENKRGKFTIEYHGFDPDYEKKFGRPLYEGTNVFEV